MSEFVHTEVKNRTGLIILDRPRALNALSLAMVRSLAGTLLAWRSDVGVDAVVIKSSSPKAFCAGGDLRFFYDAARATMSAGSALIEDFFSEEYALNYLIHHYPKPYVAIMEGVVMGGGMGLAQAGPASCMRIVTDTTKMAMPEVAIGLFPDVGGSHFLSRVPGKLGLYLALTGLPVDAFDAVHLKLADAYVPQQHMGELAALIEQTPAAGLRAAIISFAAQPVPGEHSLAAGGATLAACFSAPSVAAIMQALAISPCALAQKAHGAMLQRSPLMLCVTHAMLGRGARLSMAQCLRMERALVRRTFEHGEVIEGIRALVIDKDQAPRWSPARLDDVTDTMVAQFFEPVWPEHAHPLRDLL